MTTTIAWTGETWNPFAAFDKETGKRGWICARVSPGCLHCYAEAMNLWVGNHHKYRVPELDKVDVRVDEKMLVWPLELKKPEKIFPCSMTDLFLDAHTDEMIAQGYAIMALAHWHTFQVLTKRAERRRALLTSHEFRSLVAMFVTEYALQMTDPNDRRRDDLRATAPDVEGDDWPIRNIWEGVSAEDQERADERIPLLLDTPAAIRWVSYEPALERIDIIGKDTQGSMVHPYLDDAKLDWIVVGGESGRGARAFDPEWAAAILSQCHDTPCKVFVKQMGSVIAKRDGYVDHKGEDPAEWPESLRVREYPR